MSNQNKQKKTTHLDVLNQIRNEQPHFSTALRLIADYVLKHFHKIPFLSISALSENIGVSPNTVIKFCKRLGFSSFSEFKKVFSEHARSALTTPFPSEEDDSCNTPDFFSRGLEEEFSVISATLNNPINHENLSKAVSMIMDAKHIFVCGGTRSYPFATIFTFDLQSMCRPAHVFCYDSNYYWLNVRNATPEELVIIIDMPPYSEIAMDAMRQLQKKKVPILLLTDAAPSPAVPYADLTLYCAYRDNHYLYSSMGVHAMINVLCRGVNHQVDVNAYRKNRNRK